ncbi:MAG TPA: radical SAM protein, partial [bacterium]|nr:radical SAM protein [bacterium]
ELQRYNGRRIFFVDDNFTAVPRRSVELLEQMIRRGIHLKTWSAQARVDIAHSPELLDLMHRTNCSRVYIGFESANPKTLERFNKKQNVDDIRECVAALHKSRISVHGMFVLGADDDTPETLRETIRFTDKTKIDTVQFLALTPLPGTQTTRELQESGRIITRDWSLYDGHHVVFRPTGMTPYQLHKAIYKGMLSFYSWRNAFSYAARFDEVNAFLRILGRRLVRKADRNSSGFATWLKRREAWLSDWAERRGFEFDQGSVRQILVRFKSKLKGETAQGETHQLRISSANELKSRAMFITLNGFIDRKRAKLIKRRIKKLDDGDRSAFVLDFRNVEEITPDAVNYLARKISKLRTIRMKLIGTKGSLKEKLSTLPRTVPNFELLDSLDVLRNTLPV